MIVNFDFSSPSPSSFELQQHVAAAEYAALYRSSMDMAAAVASGYPPLPMAHMAPTAAPYPHLIPPSSYPDIKPPASKF